MAAACCRAGGAQRSAGSARPPLTPTPHSPAPTIPPPPQVKGATDTLGLLRLLRPKAYIPLNNAEFDQAGPLADLLEEQGGVDALRAQLAAAPDLAGMRVCVPQAAQPMAVDF